VQGRGGAIAAGWAEPGRLVVVLIHLRLRLRNLHGHELSARPPTTGRRARQFLGGEIKQAAGVGRGGRGRIRVQGRGEASRNTTWSVTDIRQERRFEKTPQNVASN